jgi:hypothetical protein
MSSKPQLKPTKPLTLIAFLMLLVTVLSSGCVTLFNGAGRVIFVPESDGMVRLSDDVEGHVYTLKNGEWVRSANKVKLPAGWYAGSLGEE